MDAETGFVYFWKRYYDPKTLCWLAPDPIGDGDGPNYYAYVHNNPMLYSDPDGRFAAFDLLFELVSITWGAAEVVVAAITIEAATKAVFALAVIAVAVNQGANIAEAQANSESEKITGENGGVKEGYAPDRPLPQTKPGVLIPDTDAAHTQLGTETGRKGKYRKAREFDENGAPVRDIHFTLIMGDLRDTQTRINIGEKKTLRVEHGLCRRRNQYLNGDINGK
ncbi:MAG: RHS repeat-associated core domain-containing protein [Parachlamydiaceae bacterium]|nr:RHS repeat-associated core domain-containing protein [Parachlamydiaceae bacterium]